MIPLRCMTRNGRCLRAKAISLSPLRMSVWPRTVKRGGAFLCLSKHQTAHLGGNEPFGVFWGPKLHPKSVPFGALQTLNFVVCCCEEAVFFTMEKLKKGAKMPISKKQIMALKTGDVILVNLSQFGVCCLAVLERELSNLVLSVGADRVEKLTPVRTPQWGYLTIDEDGNILNQDGDNLTDDFLHCEILAGKAEYVAEEYRRRIMPNRKLLKNGKARIYVDRGRSDEVRRMIMKIQNMVFNNDYDDDQVLLLEMYTRLVKGVPVEELPIYMSTFINTMTTFSGVRALANSIEKSFSTGEIPIGKEAEDVMERMMGKKAP